MSETPTTDQTLASTLKRYDMADSGIHYNPWKELRLSTDGDWVRYDEVIPILRDVRLEELRRMVALECFGCANPAKYRPLVHVLGTYWHGNVVCPAKHLHERIADLENDSSQKDHDE